MLGGKLCKHLIAKAIRISHTKFHCNRLTTVQDIQDYVRLILWGTWCKDEGKGDAYMSRTRE